MSRGEAGDSATDDGEPRSPQLPLAGETREDEATRQLRRVTHQTIRAVTHDMDIAARVDRRIHLVGYGPSASTVGASRAGRRRAGPVSPGRRSPFRGPREEEGAFSG